MSRGRARGDCGGWGDGDGIVSQEDYFLAKRFDLDGNGVLDADEREVGRFIMAQEFFRQHRDDIPARQDRRQLSHARQFSDRR